jgi:hypothetical protein
MSACCAGLMAMLASLVMAALAHASTAVTIGGRIGPVIRTLPSRPGAGLARSSCASPATSWGKVLPGTRR